MIGIINYNMGNLQSVKNSLDFLKIPNVFITTREEFNHCDKIILPGVGAFGLGMEQLKKKGFVEAIYNFVSTGRPLLGICLGMQLLFEFSEEHGHHQGLGLLKGGVLAFKDRIDKLPIPHMGWNTVKKVRKSRLLEGLGDDPCFYFVHSFYCAPEDNTLMVGETEYGLTFAAVVQSNTIFGCQFHPEKSQQDGFRVLQNFNNI